MELSIFAYYDGLLFGKLIVLKHKSQNCKKWPSEQLVITHHLLNIKSGRLEDLQPHYA